MATRRIPGESGQVRQLNINDTAGDLWSSFGVDLHTNVGKIKLARPFKRVADASDISDDPVQAFSSDDGQNVYAITESNLYKSTSASDYETWSVLNSTPQGAEDAVLFQGQIVISTDDDLDAYDITGDTYTSDWWTARGNPSLTSNNPVSLVPRVLEVSRIGSETLVVLDGSEVHAYKGGIGSGAITSVTVEIDSTFTASCFKSSIRKGWIGTYSESEPQAFVYEWDVASTNYIQAYPVGAKSVLAMELDNDAPVIITESGEIKKFNNAGFSTIAQFPFSGKDVFIDLVNTAFNANNINRAIHPKGIKRIGRNLYINANFRNNDGTPLDERTPAGLWVCNLDTGSLTHLGSPDNEHYFDRTSPILLAPDNEVSRIFMGADKEATSNQEGIWIEDLSSSANAYGYGTTVEIQSGNITDVFERLISKSLLDENDKIVVKWRTTNDLDYPLTVQDVAWSSTTSFNTTADLSVVKARFDASTENRDEVEFILGSGAGRLAHITNIEMSASTYVVTIDEAIGTATETATVRFDNWKKIPIEHVQSNGEKQSFGIGKEGTWGQMKIEYRGKNGYPETREILIKTNPKETL